MKNLTKTKNRLNEDLFGSSILKILSDDFFQPFEKQMIMKTNEKPKLNIVDESTHYRMEIAIPGFEKEELKLSIDNDILTVYGSKESKSEDENSSYIVKEINNERFSRSFKIQPNTLNVDMIDSTLKNGILYINIPKNKEKDNKKLIEIK